MTSALRQQQAELTRELIMDALAALLVEEGVHDLTVQQVADRSGVSHRTVYRYFPTKEALLDGLNEWVESRMAAAGGAIFPGEAEELPSLVETNFARFEDFAPLVRAIVVLSIGSRVEATRRQERTEAFRESLADHTAHLDAADIEAVVALVRLLVSSYSWFHFRDRHDVPVEASARAVRWAVDTLLSDLRSGGGPGRAGPSGPA